MEYEREDFIKYPKMARSDNAIEGCHNAIQSSDTSIQPNLWKLCGALVKEETTVQTKIIHIRRVDSAKIKKKYELNGVFGKLPSHQMAVAIMCLIGKEIREIHFGHRALPYILCAYKYIQCL